MADEWEFAREELAKAGRESSGLPTGEHVPDIVGDKAALRLVPWGGDGPDPLGEVV